VARIDPAGRIRLSPAARAALCVGVGTTAEVSGICHRVALVLGADGASLPVDARGRLLLPEWLRHAAPAVLVGTRAGVSPPVVIAPSTVLDGFADVLLGRFR
jgi:hypothetical protein